jgi:adenosylcobinamide-phosphate synthase
LYFLPWHLIAAYVLDLVLGDPSWAPHPIRWIGNLITRVEARLYPAGMEPATHLAMGCAFWGAVVAVAASVAWLLLVVAGWFHEVLAQAVGVWMAYTTLATRSLHQESLQVAAALRRSDLPAARRHVSLLVSRETAHMGEEDILRALLETVAENLSDGVVAPLFYLGLGGPVMAMVYKAVSTMDSMVGYHNDRYRYFGTCAARADDVANWLPARITGLLLVAAAACWQLDWRAAWRIMRRDGRKLKSPNAGIPEAAAAGALGVRLAGPNVYFGQLVDKPYLGDPARPVSLQAYDQMIRLLYSVSLLAMLLAYLMLCFRD